MNNIYSILESAGWYQGRNINVDYEIESLGREGFTHPNEAIIKLISEYWNLRLEFTLPDGSASDIELNIERTIANFDFDEVQSYEKLVDAELVPVALMHFRTAFVLVSFDLTFYMITEDDFYKVAESFESFLDVTINRKDIYKIS